MFEEIVKILKENYEIEDVKPESNFKKDLGLSSFDLMELAFIAEERQIIKQLFLNCEICLITLLRLGPEETINIGFEVFRIME